MLTQYMGNVEGKARWRNAVSKAEACRIGILSVPAIASRRNKESF
jgi:hypothetical protein